MTEDFASLHPSSWKMKKTVSLFCSLPLGQISTVADWVTEQAEDLVVAVPEEDGNYEIF